MFNDKYDLTAEQNLFLVKKLIEDIVYCGIQLEGSLLTFSETKTLLDGFNITNTNYDDIKNVLNMHVALKYAQSTINEPLTSDYVCKINEIVTDNANIAFGSDITKEIITNKIEELMNLKMSTTEKALTYFLWSMRSKIFENRNISTSLLCANKLMIMEGKGIIVIPASKIEEFIDLRNIYIETNERARIMKFLYDISIRGIDFPR